MGLLRGVPTLEIEPEKVAVASPVLLLTCLSVTFLEWECRLRDQICGLVLPSMPLLCVAKDTSLIISTVDTVRHTATLAAWLEDCAAALFVPL